MSGRSKQVLAGAGYAVAIVLVALYFLQSSTLAPNHTDEALLLQYIDAMAHGQRPFYDFVDAYGLVNWVFPVAFYKAFGDRIWGVRIWLVVVKVVTVVIAFVLTRALARSPAKEDPVLPGTRRDRGTFYGVMSALFTMVLLGAQWQSLQTPYAFLTVMPLTLGAWHFLLCGPLRDPRKNVRVAALLTAATLWTKLNTGMYLLAGGLFAYFYWIPLSFDDDGVPPDSPPGKRRRALAQLDPRSFTRVRAVGAVAYGLIFFLSIWRYFNVWFFLYLLVPLLLVLGWTFHVVVRDAPAPARPSRYVSPWLTFLSVNVLVSLVVLFAYYGRYSWRYVTELSGILSSIRYTAPFPPVGVPGHYIGLNEYYWLQLPLVTTALFVGWIACAGRAGPAVFGKEWPRRRAQVSALFLLITLHTFVMYARCDETHIYQALVLVVPVFFVLLSQLDAFLHAWRPSSRFPLRLAIAGFGTFFMLSLFVTPTVSAFDFGRSDWKSPKFEHLRYSDKFNHYVTATSPNLFDSDWDQAADEAAQYIKSISQPNEEILLLITERILHLGSDTRAVGGRYHFFFYLASVGLLDRAGFDTLVPKKVVADILARPPRIIVSALGSPPLENTFPEFRWLRDTRYVQTHHFRHILIYELRIDGKPVPAPLR